MNIFNVHKEIISDYSNYISSFINISDDRIREEVKKYFDTQKLWPDALIQFNPSYEISGQIEELIQQGILNEKLRHVFTNYKLYRHQIEALKLGTQNKHFVVTSGTGSGKSLTYLGTIFNYLFNLKPKEKGIKAIIVYPMNALINSQTIEIEKYKDLYEKQTSTPFPISVKQYTGQENQTQKQEVLDSLPDILLTNYMMLELIMTRLNESGLRESICENLKFIVFDELHTYRGRQGADVAMLIRRLHAFTKNELICIGTSATMSSEGSLDEQKKEVAIAAGKTFGIKLQIDQIVNEYLVPSLSETNPDIRDLQEELSISINTNLNCEQLLNSKLAQWLEYNAAIVNKNGHYFRRKPSAVVQIASDLAKQTNTDLGICKEHITNILICSNNINKLYKNTENAILPFKIHQFISQTGAVYTTLNLPDERYITMEPAAYIEGGGEQKKPLFPVVFSRNSGYEFICVRKNQQMNILEPREFTQRLAEEEEEDITLGYLLLEKDEPVWSESDIVNLPDSWLRYKSNGEAVVSSTYENRIPRRIYFDEYGNYSEAKGKLPFQGWFIISPLYFDPTSGTFFDRKTSEGTKLSKLGTEGRSTSTTILSFSTIKALHSEEQDYSEQKLLSFTDNRQDAALQAGHFNDFYKIGKIRSAIYHSVLNSAVKILDHTNIADEVYKSLQLSQEIFAKSPSELPAQQEENENVFKSYLFYRIIADLKRGWRVILPNLEQSGLIKIFYKFFDQTINIQAFYSKSRILSALNEEERKDFVLQVLDYFRKNYALNHSNLEDNEIIKRSNQIREEIKPEWGLDRNEQIDIPYYLRVETLKNTPKKIYTVSIGAQSYFGKYIKSVAKKARVEVDNKTYNDIAYELLTALENAKWISAREVTSEGRRIKVYRLELKSVLWQIGDEKTQVADKIRFQSYKEHNTSINLFFRDFYKQNFSKLKYIEAREHTAQINNEARQIREKDFREGKISVLNCSPTMELGIDIRTLNVVHHRNVPPNPSNYAQRSGRAGRGGQAALVLTYCSNYSPHDKHYFNNPISMVSGVVSPPKVDLNNEELLKAHLNSLYLAEVGLEKLDYSISDLLDLDDFPKIPIKSDVKRKLQLDSARKNIVSAYFKRAIKDIEHSLIKQHWYSESWIERQINLADRNFDNALDRWRELYRSAQRQLQRAAEIIQSNLYTNDSPEKRQAYIEQKQANRQLDLLRNKNKETSKNYSEFYPYRYLASEGFLPGYNFTRLPVRVFIPKGEEGEFISRPKFLAVREFGPMNIVYHDGARYKINQTILNDAENKIYRIKVSKSSGYALVGDDFEKDYCPLTKTYLKTDKERDTYEDLLPLAENRAAQIARISCDEEERLTMGYDIKTFFTVEGGLDRIKTVKIKDGKNELLKMQYMPAATLIKLNEKWRVRRDIGFLVNMKTGFWKSEKDLEKDTETKNIRRVRLFTTDTADALYIHPLKALAFEKGKEAEGIITLQFALKRAIENVFQVESSEIGVEVLGSPDWPNILLYESSEGSLGVLSQIVEDIELFKKIVYEAYSICYFKDGADQKPDVGPATYNDLLSYYNQKFHMDIDRHLIKEQLEKLMLCELENLSNSKYSSYDDHYSSLMERIDPNSVTEKCFIEYLYKMGLKLPDSAQDLIQDIYVRPDFYYNDGNVCVFCDGTPHDDPRIRQEDDQKRNALKIKGYDVVVYYYKDSLDELVKKRSDIFTKVR